MTDLTTLFWLNSFALFYLLLTSAILLRNRFEFKNLDGIDYKPKKFSKISVCVPARNEELVIRRLLESVCKQEYDNFELLVLDDHSTDNTPDIIRSVKQAHPDSVKQVTAEPKPDDWLGKQWSCHQLANRADGDIILFLDADTELQSGMLQKTNAAFERFGLDMITVWPRQETTTFWEKMVVPLIYYALVTLLPTIYVYRKPRWLPSFMEKKVAPLFVAACGQCLGFTSTAYKRTGGHKSVKNKIVEDVELAKIAKHKGLTLRMFEGVGTISCRMYRSEKEIFNGLRKNFFPGFNYSISLFLMMASIHFIVFVFPFFMLPFSLFIAHPALLFLSIASVFIILLHRLLLAIWFLWNPVYGLLHPISVLWYQRLAFVSLVDYFLGRKITWKGREI